jgi:hypothetical protein
MTDARIDLPLLESQIVVIRGRQVLMDAVLADLYASRPKRCFRLCAGTPIGFQRISCSSFKIMSLES